MNDVLKDFAIFTGKHLCWSLFNKIAGLKPPTQVLFCEWCSGTKERGGRHPLLFFKNHKKRPDFGKKGPDKFHLWVKIVFLG